MTLLTSSLALACGGLFCDGSSVPTSVAIPVQQTEEAVVFHVDPVADSTTMHVQISYEGPVNEFAWILPVPGVPELDRSTHRLFEQLQGGTQERWTRTDFVSSNCIDPSDFIDGESDADTDADADTDTDTDTDADGPPPVTVVSRQDVGPYATVVLTATGSQELITWLQDNHYQVPDGLEPLLAPYIAPDMHFVALKLRKDQETGDMEPLALTLEGTDPSIPMQLTAVAAADDMPLSVYMLGESRAMPANYLHVERNLARALWPTVNAPAFVGQQPALTAEAVDAAGGLAFATLYAGAPPTARPEITANLSTADLGEWAFGLSTLGLALTESEAEYVLDLHESAGVSASDLLSCVNCYPHLENAVDLEGASARLAERVLQPLNDANQMLRESPYLTRLQTALSPSEMTVDPRFTFVEGLPDIDGAHTLALSRTCELSSGREVDLEHAPFSITIDAHHVNGPTAAYLDSRNLDIVGWLREEYGNPTWAIDGVDGEGTMYRIFEDYPVGDAFEDRAACGCDQSSGFLGLSFLPLLTLLVRRRLTGPEL